MKHSSSSSMSETYEVKAMMPGNGNWNNILRNLYVDLFNLIVESRIPGINERGYGNGYHCPPLLGQNVHLCDLMKPECRKHQTMIHHLLRAVRHNVFEIEVLMLPECCSDSKLSERIQHKEYVLLERWSMTFFESDKSQFSIEIPELLRAVRSFLHFSQISAWLSATNGKSPANVYYWVKPTSDSTSTQFENSPEVHSFPLFKVNEELCGTVKVNYPTRKQYLPIIPCSKHPPLQGLRLRLNEDSNLSQSIPLNQQIVMQLQKNCDNQQSLIAVKHCATDPESLKTSSTTILKSLTQNVNDINKSNRILKYSNLQVALKSTNGIFSNSCGAQVGNKQEISSNSEATLFDNYSQNYSNCSSQENLRFEKSTISTLMHRNESKLNILNKVLHPFFFEAHPMPVELAHQHISKRHLPKCFSVSSNLSSSDMCKVTSNVSNLLLSSVGTSQSSISNVSHDSNSFLGNQRNSIHKSLKRKYLTGNELHVIPDKRVCMHEEKFEDKEIIHNELPSSFQNNSLKKPFKRKHCLSSVRPKNASTLVKCVHEENCSNKLSDKKLNVQNSTKNTSINMACITSERKVIGEKQNQTSENCLIQSFDDGFKNVLSIEKNLNLTNKFIKLVNLPLKTDCKNQIASKSLDPDNCFSTDCDILISAKLNSEMSKTLSSELNINDLGPLKTSCNTNKAIKQHNKKCLNINNEPVFNDKSDSSNSMLNINVSLEMQGNIPPISKLCYNKSHKSNNFQIQKGRVKKKYIGDFYKSCRLRNLDLRQCTNICMSDNKQAQSLELIKSSASFLDTINQRFFYSNISTAKVSKRLMLDKFFKKQKKETSQSRLKNSRKYNKASSSFVLPNKNDKNEKYVQDEIFNDFVQQQIVVENQNSKLDISNHSLLKQKPCNDSYLTSVSHKCVIGDKNMLSDAKSNNFKHKVQVTPFKQDDSVQIEKKQVFSCYNSCNVLPQKATSYLHCFPRHKLKFARGRKLLGNFEESILKGCLLPVNNVKGFHTEIGASGSFCPNHITLPADVSFYDMDNLCSGASPYMAHVTLGDTEYYVPKKGAVQVTLFNPSETVVKMFVLNYDLSNMPPSCHTFIRQKTYYMPVGSTEDSPSSRKWLRFILHLRFASSKTGKLFLHEDFKIVVLNKSNDDAASEFNQEPRELRSFLHVPMNPTFSNF